MVAGVVLSALNKCLFSIGSSDSEGSDNLGLIITHGRRESERRRRSWCDLTFIL